MNRAGCPNTRHDVSSAWAYPAAALRAAIAAASGSSSRPSRRATPASVPGATSSPCIASIAITRWNGSPSAYLATSRFTQNSVLNRPLPISLGGPGAVTTAGHRHRQRRAYLRRRCTTRHTRTRQETCSLTSSPSSSYGCPQRGQRRCSSGRSCTCSSASRCSWRRRPCPADPGRWPRRRPRSACPVPPSPSPPALVPSSRLPGGSFSLEVPKSIRLSVTTRCFSASTCRRWASTVAASVAFSAANRPASASQNSARERHNAASSAARPQRADASITPRLDHHHSLCPAPPDRVSRVSLTGSPNTYVKSVRARCRWRRPSPALPPGAVSRRGLAA